MDLRTKTTDYQMTPEVASYLGEKIASIERLLGTDSHGARLEVELGRDTGRMQHGAHVWFAEMTLSVPGGAHARATNRASTINAAIDDVKEELEKQIRRSKKLHKRLIRKGGALAKRLLRLQ